jgi:hypothetical protein
MTNRFAIALALSCALALSACGRDDKQEKIGGSAASPSPSSSATDKSVGTTRGPLQTGELAKEGPGLPDGTKTGARTTPNPK